MLAAAPLLLLLAVRIGAWEDFEGTKWQRSTEPPWAAHTGSIATTMADGSIMLLGGQKGEHGGALFDCFNCTNDVWSFDVAKETWTDFSADVPWDPRWGHSAVTTSDGSLWLLFGCCERGKPTVMLQDIWVLHPGDKVGWALVDTHPPFEGIQATSVSVLGDDLWVVGGWSQSRGTLSQVAVFNTNTITWTEKSKHGEAPWLHRADHATAITPDGKWLLMYAGQHRDAKTGEWSRLKDTWRVPLPAARASEWEQLGDLNAARSSVPVVIVQSRWLLALGGHWVPPDEQLKVEQNDREGMIDHHRKGKFHTYNDVVALDLQLAGKGGWQVVEASAPWPSRDDCAAAAATDGSMVIFGGGTLYGGGGYLRDVWRLPDPASYYKLAASAAPKNEL